MSEPLNLRTLEQHLDRHCCCVRQFEVLTLIALVRDVRGLIQEAESPNVEHAQALDAWFAKVKDEAQP